MAVYVCGDTHVPSSDVGKLNSHNWWTRRSLTKEDFLIILGDFGVLWENVQTKEELYWLKWFTVFQCTVCFLDGNHENMRRLADLEVIDFHEGKAGIAYSDENGTIYHLKRGEVYNFEGQTILTFGGATSTDKARRIAYKSWWPEEVYNQEEWDNLIKNLEKHNYSVDYVLTHTAPSKVLASMPNISYQSIERINCPVAQALQQILPQIQFKQWHYGHMHCVNVIDDHFFCHYENNPFRII